MSHEVVEHFPLKNPKKNIWNVFKVGVEVAKSSVGLLKALFLFNEPPIYKD